MKDQDDFLVEILTEELPSKTLLKLAHDFRQLIEEHLQKASVYFEETKSFSTPRRLAVLVKNLAAQQADQRIERKGPAKAAAFDINGRPTQACIGFARACGVTPEELITIKNGEGEWVGYKQHVPGKSIIDVIPTIIEQAVAMLPQSKRMRWGESEVKFIRPVISILMLYGDQVIDATLLGCRANRVTYGHRFYAPAPITIPHPAAYESLLETEGYVVVDAEKRRARIESSSRILAHQVAEGAILEINQTLLDEVTGLVEWPVPLLGCFDKKFLALPQEVLISAMQDHQRYFPIENAQNKLLPYFITVSNIQSQHPQQVIRGNERVLQARLSDAAFFWEMDSKEPLVQRIDRLKGIIFQAKLGTLYDKAVRMSQIADYIAKRMGIKTDNAAHASLLAKTDLTTNMVNEFPELQGIMGYYYALHDGESEEIATAIKEHYLPRFAGDRLPRQSISQAVALADRIDSLLGHFGIHLIPTGDKDPFGLRRAALGILRILIEEKIDLDLNTALHIAAQGYPNQLENTAAVEQTLNFLQERLRVYYQEKGISTDVFSAVAAIQIVNPLDADKRIHAVQAFKKLNEAEALSIANKRVSNILSKYTRVIDADAIDPMLFESDVEKLLAQQLEQKSEAVKQLSRQGRYEQILLALAELRQPVDDFFDHVMVMTEDKRRRENRILLLKNLRALFLHVADIALLQGRQS